MSTKSSEESDLSSTGVSGELATALELTRRGWLVSFPFSAMAPFDLIASKGRKIVRIQVKACEPLTEKDRSCRRYRFRTMRKGQVPYALNDFDFWVFVALEHQVFFVIPKSQPIPVHPQWRPSARSGWLDEWRGRFELMEKV